MTYFWTPIVASAGKEHNFAVYTEETDVLNLTGAPYDYNSLMHAHEFTFARDAAIPTIIPKNPHQEIGQRDQLSVLDVERVQVLYGCKTEKEINNFKLNWTQYA